MPRTKTNAKSASPAAPGRRVPGEVLTLPEAAGYLRLSEEEVISLVEGQGLPARRAGREWRFLKAAIQDWLRSPATRADSPDLWAWAGAFREDRDWEELVREAYRRRGRSAAEGE